MIPVTVYLQVEVNLSMGIVAIFAIQLTGIIIFLPFAIGQLGESKQYEATPDDVITTKVDSSQDNFVVSEGHFEMIL